MASPSRPSGPGERERRIARILKPLGKAPMLRAQAEMAGRLLGVHWTTVYRLRRRYLADPVATSVQRDEPGPRPGKPLVSRELK